MMENHPDLDAEYLWMTAPSEAELERRLRGRATDAESAIQLRVNNAKSEIAKAATIPFDHRLINDHPDLAYETLKGIIDARREACQELRGKMARGLGGLKQGKAVR